MLNISSLLGNRAPGFHPINLKLIEQQFLSPLPQAPVTNTVFRFCEADSFGYLVEVESYRICLLPSLVLFMKEVLAWLTGGWDLSHLWRQGMSGSQALQRGGMERQPNADPPSR